VKTGNQVFEEHLLRDCSINPQVPLLPGVCGGDGRSALQPLFTASSGMTTPTGAMSTSATGSGAAWYVLVHPLFSVTKIMIISIIYMFVSLGSHVHISKATNLFLIFFWIKLILELPKFLTIEELFLL
jgi:hypothetical protein